jgi:hypothetical protein
MENFGLMYIPDMSGFTKFVTQTEIVHGSQIISDLLVGFETTKLVQPSLK